VIESNCGEVLKHVKRLVMKVAKHDTSSIVEDYDAPTNHQNYFSIRTPKSMSNQAQTTDADQVSKAIQTIEPAAEKGTIQDLEMVARS